MNFRFTVLATVFAILLMSGCSNKTELETAEKAKQEQLAKEKAEAERIAREKAEAERIAMEKAEAERIAKEKAEAERIAREKAEVERIAREKAEAERIAMEQKRQEAFQELEQATEIVKTQTIPTGAVELSDDLKINLDVVAETLIKYPDSRVEIKAYTDSIGSEQRNLELSQMRADKVKDYLLAKGVNPQQVQATGFGETNFINPENPESIENRRIELEVISQ